MRDDGAGPRDDRPRRARTLLPAAAITGGVMLAMLAGAIALARRRRRRSR